ncbi:hypothetical protein DF3PB_3290003 [uncultured Defluviicoccus sp.]|nr:hypothetical protein DF3PB_3290003 [uncultured Defluviicoccus sp.]
MATLLNADPGGIAAWCPIVVWDPNGARVTNADRARITRA